MIPIAIIKKVRTARKKLERIESKAIRIFSIKLITAKKLNGQTPKLRQDKGNIQNTKYPKFIEG